MLFLEEDPQALLTLLHTEMGALLISHPQVGIYWLEGGESQRLLLTQLTWDFLQSRWYFSNVPSDHPQVTIEQKFQEELDIIRTHIHLLAEELLQFGDLYFTNFYENLGALEESGCGDRLFGKFHGLPIFVCGSGPSLQAQIEMLRPLKDRALIIAAGSAAPVLLSHGIVPHFGVAVDPTLSQAERLEAQIGVDIPYFYRPRIHPRALRAVKGRRLYVTGTGSYQAPLYVEQLLKLPDSQVEEGYNVLHFALSIAKALQGKPSKQAPLILLGADGAYSNTQEYSRGIPTSSRVQKEEDHLKTTRIDIEGNRLVTRKQWLAERAWFTQFAMSHPRTFFINASEGLPIEGIPHIPLKECVKRYCTDLYDLEGRVWSTLQQTALPVGSFEKIRKLLTKWKASLARIAGAMHMAQEDIAKNNWHLVACAETMWQCEGAYDPILSLFERIYTRLQNVSERKSERLSASARDSEQKRLFTERLRFLMAGCELHLKLLDAAPTKPWEDRQNNLALPTLRGKDRTCKIQCSTKEGRVDGTQQEETIVFKTHSGVILAEDHFKNGCREGVQRHFYVTGEIAWEGDYDKGMPKGIHRTFYPNGTLKQAIDYSNGFSLL